MRGCPLHMSTTHAQPCLLNMGTAATAHAGESAVWTACMASPVLPLHNACPSSENLEIGLIGCRETRWEQHSAPA